MKNYVNELEVFEAMVKYENRTLGSIDGFSSNVSTKSYVGYIVEKSIFEYQPNSKSFADIENLDLEIKSTPVRKTKDRYVSKERLVLNIINYIKEDWENFYESSFWKKNKKLLIVFYEYFLDKPKSEFKILKSIIYKYPKDDLLIILNDWSIISNKVRNGLAHEISERDTMYLAACTKGANSNSKRSQPYSTFLAKQRAYSFKSSYMTTVFNDYVICNKKNERIINNLELKIGSFNLEKHVENIFKPYFGKSKNELLNLFGLEYENEPKSVYAIITKKIFGVERSIDEIDEFKKAGIVPKTVRVESNGSINEHMSFQIFKFTEIVNENWEDSDMFDIITNKRLLLITFSFDQDKNDYKLNKILFWDLSKRDIEECKMVWEKTKRTTIDGIILNKVGNKVFNNLPKQSESYIMHVRPKANDGNDKYKLPDGREITKQCFWLNREYILSVLKQNDVV